MLSNKQTECAREDAQRSRDRIKELIKVYPSMPSGPTQVRMGQWNEIPKTGVFIQPSILDSRTDDHTIFVVEFQPGGFLEEHKHESDETIFLIKGDYYDHINGVVLRPNQTQFIEKEKLHGGQSDTGCFLLVVWHPPLNMEIL